jgi:hypothetical protein
VIAVRGVTFPYDSFQQFTHPLPTVVTVVISFEETAMLFRKIVLLAIASFPLAAAAQPPGPPMLDMEKLAILLDLDAYQQSEVERVFEERRESMRALRDSSDERPSRDEMRAAREAARSETLAELQAVLSIEQLEKFEVLMEFVAQARGRGRGGFRR